MELKRITHAENVRLSDSGRAVRILDQSRLPNETVYLELSQAEDLYEAIASLRVRGAPAIGIFAGYALYVLALQSQETQYGPFLDACRRNRDYLNSSRPTAVNLRHMLDRVLAVAESMPCADVPSIQAAMGQAARAIHQEDIAMCTAISEYGLSLVKAGDGILTHCNAGPLATSRYGTGLGPLFLAKERGIPVEYLKMLSTPLAVLEITPRILRRLREYNIYLLEDLLRFVKKNGFNALAKLHGIGMKSCEDLYSVLKRKGIMESKDNCHLFQYIWV